MRFRKVEIRKRSLVVGFNNNLRGNMEVHTELGFCRHDHEVRRLKRRSTRVRTLLGLESIISQP